MSGWDSSDPLAPGGVAGPLPGHDDPVHNGGQGAPGAMLPRQDGGCDIGVRVRETPHYSQAAHAGQPESPANKSPTRHHPSPSRPGSGSAPLPARLGRLELD